MIFYIIRFSALFFTVLCIKHDIRCYFASAKPGHTHYKVLYDRTKYTHMMYT